MTPVVDTNVPPETWITAAPQDTATTHDENGNAVPPQTWTIPFRFHLYWSGSDQDGAIAGFYWAVTETVGSVGGLPVPPLPGPKPLDYHYTSATDSVFVFNVLEDSNTRQHAFYIYAVDDKGKPDATPARVIFNTLDRFPPIPVINDAFDPAQPDNYSRATGFILRPNQAWNGIGPVPVLTETTIALRDTFNVRTRVSDIVPVSSVIRMRWHSEISVANNPAVYYKYKIGEGNEVDFVQVPASVTGTEYNTTDRNRLGPGLKVFTLRAVDQAGGARTSPETTRRFYVNMLPDTWFAGPDTIPPGYTNVSNFYTTTWFSGIPGVGKVKERYFQVGQGSVRDWTRAIPGSLMGPDSVQIMPARRKANRTFFEIYTEYNFQNTSQPFHRIYVHSEGDTVHLNSWVLFYGGGFDPDSPYRLAVVINHPSLPGIGTTPVLTSGPTNGSPIGLHHRISVFQDSLGPVDDLPQSRLFPSSNAFVAEPHVGGYQGMQASGRAYAILRSEDGDQGIDNRIDSPAAFVDSIERGLIREFDDNGKPNPRYALRDKVLTFYVNRAPYLRTDLPTFEPRPCTAARPNDCVYPTRTIRLRLDLVADDDPFQRATQSDVGGMIDTRSQKIIRYNVTLRGRRTGSNPPRDTVYTPPNLRRRIGVAVDTPLDVEPFIAGPDVVVEIEVCDCADCETVPGQGRCRRYPPFIVKVPVLTPGLPASPAQSSVSPTGPGSSGESSRSRTP